MYKLHNTTSTWVYVKTTTSYNSDGSPGWGLPYEVYEDQGTGKINRRTRTSSYDRAGRATQVLDGADRTFVTTYNPRGQVELVKRTDTTPDIDIVAYTYGETDATAENGMVTLVEDLLSGAFTTVEYYGTGSGVAEADRGQVSVVYNNDGLLWSDYFASYFYDAAGRRSGVSYKFEWQLTSGDSTFTNYGYSDYIAVGSPESPSYVFQTMTLLTADDPEEAEPEATAEEFHYRFDTAGRMLESAFAQTSQNSSAPFYPSQAAPSANPALRRALAVYDYRPAGELAEVRYHWQNLGEFGYDTTNIRRVEYAYEDYKGLRKSATRYTGSGTSWGSGTEDEYQYDADLDYLTAVDYSSTSGSSFTADDSWTYDAAGNRSNSGYTYDNLNRMTASPGSMTYTNDILGNRTWRNPSSSTTVRYSWDDAGRMTQVAGSSSGANYMYRADGMRIKKVTGLSIAWQPPEGEAGGFYNETQSDDNPTWRYRYDGQMCFEEDFTRDYPVVVTGTSYALGARGIDMMRTFTVNQSTYERTYDTNGKSFPIYDGHGNMIATLGRSSSSPYYSIGNERQYDVWGDVRTTNGTGDPNNRYCANLGHKQDDESDLIYMRARFYEPGTGRFISQDIARDGRNWYTYCGNMPTIFVDESGNFSMPAWANRIFAGLGGLAWLKAMWHLAATILCNVAANISVSAERVTFLTMAVDQFKFACVWFAIAMEGAEPNGIGFLSALLTLCRPFQNLLTSIVLGMQQGSQGHAAIAVIALGIYSGIIFACILGTLITGE